MKGRGGSEPPPLCALVQEVLVILAGELVPGIGATAQGLAVTQLLDVPKAGCDPAVAVGVVAKEGTGDAAEATGVHLALVDDGLHRGVHDLRLLATVGVDEVGILVRRVIRAVDVAIPQGGLEVGRDLAAPLGQGVLLDIFDNYNFTMSEDEPLEREVAIDPEMLGKVFENLLEVNDRKSKGAFYTPREIVHYMCQESLISYLTRVMKVKESAIRDFIMVGDFMKDEDASVLKRAEKGESYDLWISEELYLLGKDGSIIVDRMAELDRALQDVRVADPAVGSGAFPLGMLNEIVRARQNITTYMDITQKIRDPKGAGREIRYRRINERSAHRLKYETIRNCIFAVDIEPSAVDIAQLRLWLALVIDDEIDPNAATDLDGHRNPLPLPNLECNILCGDSLLDEFEGYKLINDSDLIGNAANNTQIDAYRSAFNATLERLIEKQEELFRCDNTVKKAVLLNQIEDLRNSIIMIQLESANAEAVERYKETRHLATKPFILWQLDFARVFRAKGGFDIVIGNPPYIQLQKAIDEDSGKKLGDLYSSYGFETFAKTGDIYCLFYEKGNMLLRQGGILSFITSNKWMRAGYGKSLRQYLANNTNPLILIDFSGTKVFTTATVDVNILMFSKESNAERTILYAERPSSSACIGIQARWRMRWKEPLSKVWSQGRRTFSSV